MSVTLPYPTLSAAFTITGGATIQVFAPTTVHNDVNHNNPHAKLLANDNALKGAVDTLQAQSAGSLVRLTMAEVYRIANNTGFASASFPPEFVNISVVNFANNGSWQTHAYPVSVPTPSKSIIVQCFIATSSSSSAYIRFRSASLFPDAVVAESNSRANSDDTSGNTVLIELPYAAARTFESFCHIKVGSGLIILFVVGYRA